MNHTLVQALPAADFATDAPVICGNDADAYAGLGIADHGAKGVSDGNHPFAYKQIVGVAQARKGKRVVGTHAQHGNIRPLVRADDFHVQRAPIRQGCGSNAVRILYHMIVGENVALCIEQETRADTLHNAPLDTGSAEIKVEHAHEVAGKGVRDLFFPDFQHVDGDHGRLHRLDGGHNGIFAGLIKV
ncbi:MAG: hypothetical protein BWX80_00797 [Candidatus Hydrogenedentes bacterium ADurb.Bin101]|nr:MAG: hypothetical protein BWX80_00797 [Candidatus Hydrogenedentes bacterium ADurb.Bin101]